MKDEIVTTKNIPLSSLSKKELMELLSLSESGE